MITYEILIILIFVVLPIIFIVWFIRIIKLYKKGKSKRKSFYLQLGIFSIILIFITWDLRIFPLSKNIYIKDQTEKLTGKSFWSWKEFSFEEISVRGEGYTIDVFKFNDEIAEYFKNPDKEFFETFPIELEYRKKWKREKWKKTPVLKSEIEFLETATPNYGGWSQYRKDKMDFVKELANQKGNFYAYNTKLGDVDFFIISPTEKLIVMINHNW